MQFVMLSRVGPGNILHGDVDVSQERALLGVPGRLKIIGFGGLGIRVSCAKNGWTDSNDLYVTRMKCLWLPFAGRDDYACVKILVALTFLIAINSLTRSFRDNALINALTFSQKCQWSVYCNTLY